MPKSACKISIYDMVVYAEKIKRLSISIKYIYLFWSYLKEKLRRISLSMFKLWLVVYEIMNDLSKNNSLYQKK